MRGFEIDIKADNPAFEGAAAQEIARILRRVIDRLEENGFDGFEMVLRDLNGNHVGHAVSYSDEDDG